MRVVVWASYGEIDVYAADTTEQLVKVIDMMIDAVKGWGLDRKVTLIQQHLAKHPDDYKAAKGCFHSLVEAVEPGTHESFEKIQIKEMK